MIQRNPQSPDLLIQIAALKKERDELIGTIKTLVAEVAKSCDAATTLANSIVANGTYGK